MNNAVNSTRQKRRTYRKSVSSQSEIHVEIEKFELFVTINNFVTCITLQVHSVRFKLVENKTITCIVKGRQSCFSYFPLTMNVLF